MIRGALEILRVALLVPLVSARFFATGRGGDREARRGAYVLALVRALGPMYTKLAQVLAAQSGYVPERFRAELRGVFDRNEPAPYRIVRRQLEAAYGRSVETVFATFEPRSIGCGSVAQVHRATLADGTRVAVKLIKPGAAAALRSALSAAAILIAFADRFVPSLRPLRLADNFADIRDSLLRQTDLRLEAEKQIEVAARFAGHGFAVIPRVHLGACTDEILVMDYVEGVPIHEQDRIGGDRALLAERMQDAFYTMIYLHGQFHVDPHPGNMLLLADGRLALLDFGMVARLDEQDKWKLAGFYYACLRAEWRCAVARFAGLFVDQGESLAGDEAFAEQLCRILQTHFRDRTDRWSTIGFVSDAAGLLRARGLRMKPGMALLILALATGEGVLLDVDPKIDIWRNARRFVDKASPYVNAAVKERFDGLFLNGWTAGNELVGKANDVLVAPLHLHRFCLPSEYPLVVARAQGAYLYDADGNEFIDLSGGFGPHILGYGHPVVTAAIAATSESVLVNALTTRHEVALAELIAGAFPSADKVIFANSGSEAVTMALRLCRAHNGRQKVAKFEGHYHGQSDQGLVSSWFRFAGDEDRPTAISGCNGAFAPVVRDTIVLPFGSDAALDRLREQADEIACVICEPMPGASCEVDADYLRRLSETCRAHDVPLVFDEVVTGFRVDYGGVQTLAGVEPDLTCLGKIIGGGLPCGAVAGRREIIDLARTTGDPFADLERKTFVGGTFSGNALTCAAGAAVLRHLRDDRSLYRRLAERTSWLKAALEEAAAEEGVSMQVAAQTGIMSLEFSPTPLRTVRQKISNSNFRANLALAYYMRERGVYLPELHTLMISMAHEERELTKIVAAFRESVIAMKQDAIVATTWKKPEHHAEPSAAIA